MASVLRVRHICNTTVTHATHQGLGERLTGNLVAWGTAGFVMVWTNQKSWPDSGVPLTYFRVLWAGYNLIVGLAGRPRRPFPARLSSSMSTTLGR